jgi:rubredoxin
MDKYVCTACGYIIDPEVGDPDGGIAPGTSFEDIPADWYVRYAALERYVSKRQ